MDVRATGVLIEDNRILLLKQKVNDRRGWSLPGGKLEQGEMLSTCLIREIKEETGLDVEIGKLLYVCDIITENMHILHITFLIKRIGGVLGDLEEGKDTNPILDVKMVPLVNLGECGFSSTFVDLIKNNFPHAGSYMGEKKNIGL